MKKEPFLKPFPAFFKIISLLIITIITWFIINILGVLIAFPFWGTDVMNILTGGLNLSIKDNVNLYKYLQIINHLGMFMIPSLIFAFLARRNISKYLKINMMPKMFTLATGILLVLVCLPFINWLMTINEMMKLPEFLSGVEVWMRNSEESATLIINEFLNVKSIGGLFINLLMIAVIPAIGEEFLFRGVLQKQFKEWFGNIHVAIFIASFLFSAIHLQFFGFIPRFVLGMLLGYLFYFSNNLWVPIIAHFFNNGIAVLIYYLNFNKITHTDIDKLGSSNNDIFLIIISLFFTIILMISVYKREHTSKKGAIKKEDL